MNEKLKCTERKSKRKFVRSNHVLEISHAYIFEVTHMISASARVLEVNLSSSHDDGFTATQMLRRRPPSTGNETPRIAPAAGEAKKAMTEAVSNGSINRSIGT